MDSNKFDIEAFRRKLQQGGAVAMFDELSDNDAAAERATAGLPPATPGLGLYRKENGVYEAQVEATYIPTGKPDFRAFSAVEWSQYLASREPRAEYIHHYIAQGSRHKGADLNWKMVIVHFRIVDKS